MSNPVIFEIPAGSWVPVAANVTTGQIWEMSTAPIMYLQTYRDTGGIAPTLESEGVIIFLNDNNIPISANAGIDIYIWAKGGDGRIRVDLP